jgi:deoxyribodipyrimidine photo-lyase
MDGRVRAINRAPVRHDATYVLYWMIAARRTRFNFALERAIAWAAELRLPLIVFEPLRCDYPWASDRHHAFVIQGMQDNATALRRKRATYYPFIERRVGDGKGLLRRLAREAAVVVTDDYPAFFLPRMIAAAGRALDVSLEAVDGNGLMPLATADREFTTAASFRRFLHKRLPEHLRTVPAEDPFAAARLVAPPIDVPEDITRRWPAASDVALERLPVDHEVAPVKRRGGQQAARRVLKQFLGHRQRPTGLSPYLHFGHISTHEIFDALMTRERWTTRRIQPTKAGRREGWWGASAEAEAFLDQLVTWRELGFNMCHRRADYDRFASLPAWARATLKKHQRDKRPHRYTLDEFEHARTHDPLWNAAQRQLVRDGGIDNYFRMLWGKKILEWSATPESALDTLIHLNNKYARDGRDPNSYNGIFWILGRYDRPWGPERPIFGTVRYMSSANTARKMNVRPYLAKYAAD